jgi:Mor family transcriptional regulator
MKSWLAELQPEDLRGDYAELVPVIGLELTVRVAEEIGGAPLLLPYVAEISHPDHLRSGYLDLYPLIGLALTAAVAAQLGGGQLYLAQVRHVLKAAKERYVRNNDRVQNRRILARETGLSLRHVYRICEGKSQSRRAVDPNQLSLPV